MLQPIWGGGRVDGFTRVGDFKMILTWKLRIIVAYQREQA